MKRLVALRPSHRRSQRAHGCSFGVKRLLWAMLLAVVLIAPSAAYARNGFAGQAGWGFATLGANIVYMPVKFLYATTGGLTGTLAFLLTGADTETAKAIWRPSLGGTYVLSTAMLQGREPIHFSGGGYQSRPRYR